MDLMLEYLYERKTLPLGSFTNLMALRDLETDLVYMSHMLSSYLHPCAI